MSVVSFVGNGLLKSDGTLELDHPPKLPPGRVRVTLQTLGEVEATRLPDPPLMDDNISAPFDLPRPGAAARVHPLHVTERLPEVLEGIQEAAE